MITQADINKIEQSDWYAYELDCGHTLYSKVRINVPQSFMEHFILCPKCQQDEKTQDTKTITAWKAITGMGAANDEQMSNVFDGLSFVVPRRILRTDGTAHKRNGIVHIPSGNPFPYTTKDRGY